MATSNTYKLVFSTTATPATNCTDGTQIYLGTGTSHNHTGLTNGTAYYYRVCAWDAVNNISTGATANATPTTPGTPFLAGYTKRKKITIDNTYVDTDLTNFPLYVKINNDANMASARADGFDIRFTSSDGTTLLVYERESWSGGGGSNVNANIWVKVFTVYGSVDTDIYIYYGKSDATDGSVPTNVWGNDFKGVWHSKDATATTINDSTSNASNGTKKAANQPIEATGQIDKAQQYDGIDDFVETGKKIVPHKDAFSISLWFKYLGAASSTYYGLISEDFDSSNKAWNISVNGNGYVSYGQYSGTEGMGRTTTASVFSTNVWVSLTLTRSDAGGINLYINNLPATLNSNVATDGGAGSPTLRIGRNRNAYSNSIIDEVRISNIARSAEWIKFEYNNMASGDNELTWGAEE